MHKMFDSVFFFFSSRRRHTRFDCDWSSDVCSSDLTSTCIRQVSKFRMRHSPLFVSREINFTATGTTRYDPGCREPSEIQNWKSYFASDALIVYVRRIRVPEYKKHHHHRRVHQ